MAENIIRKEFFKRIPRKIFIITIMLVLAVSSTAFAGIGGVPDIPVMIAQFQLPVVTIELEWEQTIIPEFSGWKLYEGEVQGGPYNWIVDIPYVSEQAEYSSSQPIPLSEPGVTIYIVLTAFNQFGESEPSNEVSQSFQVPAAPFILRIIVVVPEE